MMRRGAFLVPFLLFFAGAILVTGSTPWSTALEGAWAKWNGEPGWSCLLDERLPRLLVILCTGASLSVSGAVTQALFRNPLASPSVLGITFGGAFCVVLTFIAGWHFHYPMSVPIAAAVGSFLTLLIVTALSTHMGRIELSALVLNGIALTTVLVAVQKVTLYVLRDEWVLVQTLTEWEAGSTADRTWQHVYMQLPLTLIGLFGCFFYRRELNILALGEEEATSLGVDVERVRLHLFLSVALLTGGALAAVGIISFFGLLLPHLLRKLWGPDNETLLPLSAIGGATLLAGLEVLLRFSGIHLFTIGNISSLLGGLFFLLVLFGERRRMGETLC